MYMLTPMRINTATRMSFGVYSSGPLYKGSIGGSIGG